MAMKIIIVSYCIILYCKGAFKSTLQIRRATTGFSGPIKYEIFLFWNAVLLQTDAQCTLKTST
jgi:hypothetical protein